MWPLDLPARQVLKLPGETEIPWAVFDWRWYLRSYPEVVTIVGDDDPPSVLEYYAEIGQRQGHSPNRMFDESWHRRVYPHIAARIAAGEWRSAFDSYCRRGALDRSPHWLFDEPGYRARYPNLTNALFAEQGIFNGYDHYLRRGIEEDRAGHVLFDPNVYLGHFDLADIPAIRQTGVFQHYLDRIESGKPELRTSIYFDPAWYVRRYPEVARDIATGRWKCALHHYLCNESPTAFDPLASFSESWYFERDPSLLDFIASLGFRNGYMHFLLYGARELRPPTGSIDLRWYAAQPSVRNDLDNARAPDAFAHWLMIGATAGLPSTRPPTDAVTAAQARDLFDESAAAMLPIAGRYPISFECRGEPLVSVVIPVRNDFATTLATLTSLRASTPAEIELIIVDQGSDDETRSIQASIRGAKIIRLDTTAQWCDAADTGRQHASAPAVLFLSQTARIIPGSLLRAIDRLNAAPETGAVGGMILQPHGVIAQAGGILWNSGAPHDYRRDDSPLVPEANFVRTVDFCSAAFLLIRAKLLTQLGGFDHDCAAGYDTIELCLRIASAGFRVVYDPSVRVVLLDPSRPGPPGEHLRTKHAAVLEDHFAPGDAIQVFARFAGTRPNGVLFITDRVPLRRMGGSAARANDLVHTMTSSGYAVTVFPMDAGGQDLAHVFADMPETAEIMHDSGFERLAGFLEARPGYYETVWISGAHHLPRLRPILLRLTAEGLLNARMVLDVEAVPPPDPPLPMDAIQSATVVTATAAEAEILRGQGCRTVSVIGPLLAAKPTPRSFIRRSGILLFATPDPDGSDSVGWFLEHVLPLIESTLGSDTRLTIAGVDRGNRFAGHPLIAPAGEAADLGQLYGTHRVVVVPAPHAGARFAVLEAAAHGVPVVTTDHARSALGWTAGREVLATQADDPAAFATAVLTLYRHELRWLSVRASALQRVMAAHGRQATVNSVKAVLTAFRDPESYSQERLVAEEWQEP